MVFPKDIIFLIAEKCTGQTLLSMLLLSKKIYAMIFPRLIKPMIVTHGGLTHACKQGYTRYYIEHLGDIQPSAADLLAATSQGNLDIVEHILSTKHIAEVLHSSMAAGFSPNFRTFIIYRCIKEKRYLAIDLIAKCSDIYFDLLWSYIAHVETVDCQGIIRVLLNVTRNPLRGRYHLYVYPLCYLLSHESATQEDERMVTEFITSLANDYVDSVMAFVRNISANIINRNIVPTSLSHICVN